MLPLSDRGRQTIESANWFLMHTEAVIHQELGGGLFDLPRHPSVAFALAVDALLLVQAYTTLEIALRTLHSEQLFASKQVGLSALMAASQTQLPWTNYDVIDDGRVLRNRIVHERVSLQPFQAGQYVNAVRHQIAGWLADDRIP